MVMETKYKMENDHLCEWCECPYNKRITQVASVYCTMICKAFIYDNDENCIIVCDPNRLEKE